MKNPTITSGITVDFGSQHPYVGLTLGKVEYRIYEDREGWFVEGSYTAVPPRANSAKAIKRAIDLAGAEAFLELLAGRIDKYKMKELAGI